eukprot:363066-Chlamydomonas_euryale.AAC.9
MCGGGSRGPRGPAIARYSAQVGGGDSHIADGAGRLHAGSPGLQDLTGRGVRWTLTGVSTRHANASAQEASAGRWRAHSPMPRQLGQRARRSQSASSLGSDEQRSAEPCIRLLAPSSRTCCSAARCLSVHVH